MSFFKQGVLQPILGIFKKSKKDDVEILKCIKCGKEVECRSYMKGHTITCECGSILEKEKLN